MAHLPVYLFGLYISTCNYGLSVKEASAEISFVRIFDRGRGMDMQGGSLSCTCGGGRLYRTGFPFYQQDLRRRIWLRGQYPDPDHGNIYRILGDTLSAYGSILHGCGIFSFFDDTPQVQQEIFISVCAVSGGGIYRRDVHWHILSREKSREDTGEDI